MILSKVYGKINQILMSIRRKLIKILIITIHIHPNWDQLPERQGYKSKSYKITRLSQALKVL